MPVSVDLPVPYAPASAILELIERHRNKGLPPIVDADVLARAGVSDSLIPRTLQAMKTLDLLTDDGRPSKVFEGIRLAPSAEYQQRMAEWLKSAYADALNFVDPTTDDEVTIRDAFRKYTPTGQQPRMVSLFIGLFTAAGVMQQRQKASSSQSPTKHRQVISKSGRMLPVKLVRSRNEQNTDIRQVPALPKSEVPPALAGLLATLPMESGVWTQERRDKFVATFSAVLDYTFSIGEPSVPVTEYDGQSDD